jgi:hypothetical protein
MMHLYDRATMAHALTLELDTRLHSLLAQRIAALKTPKYDITDDTEFLIVQAGDTQADIVRHVGFSPLVEPIDGHRFGAERFYPWWDWLQRHDGWFELIVTFGSTLPTCCSSKTANARTPTCSRCVGGSYEASWLHPRRLRYASHRKGRYYRSNVGGGSRHCDRRCHKTNRNPDSRWRANCFGHIQRLSRCNARDIGADVRRELGPSSRSAKKQNPTID